MTRLPEEQLTGTRAEPHWGRMRWGRQIRTVRAALPGRPGRREGRKNERREQARLTTFAAIATVFRGVAAYEASSGHAEWNGKEAETTERTDGPAAGFRRQGQGKDDGQQDCASQVSAERPCSMSAWTYRER